MDVLLGALEGGLGGRRRRRCSPLEPQRRPSRPSQQTRRSTLLRAPTSPEAQRAELPAELGAEWLAGGPGAEGRPPLHTPRPSAVGSPCARPEAGGRERRLLAPGGGAGMAVSVAALSALGLTRRQARGPRAYSPPIGGIGERSPRCCSSARRRCASASSTSTRALACTAAPRRSSAPARPEAQYTSATAR